jgi:hypothetical protein
MALVMSAGIASAQTVTTTIDISPEQERTIYGTVVKERIVSPPPAELSVSVGTEIPSAVELYEMPAAVTVAPARRYRYTVVNDRVVLVDPGTRKVVRVISQ